MLWALSRRSFVPALVSVCYTTHRAPHLEQHATPSNAMSPADPELRELAVRYATACDRRDTAAFAAVFTEDGRLRVFQSADAPAPRTDVAGREQLAGIPGLLERFHRTLHFVGNTSYRVEGDEAEGEVYCIAHHVRLHGGAASDHVMFIRYQDRYRRAGSWRIADRRVLVDWTETRPVDNRN
jgi:3-phenylpropionate/cinnamic acid dioxygenase small subunit